METTGSNRWGREFLLASLGSPETWISLAKTAEVLAIYPQLHQNREMY
jgi:hypothetical protein